VLLQEERGQRAPEEQPLDPGKVVRREPGLGREAAHRLVREKEHQERRPVLDELAAPAHGERDQEQCQHHPLRLDRDAARQHHAEDHHQVEDAADQEHPRRDAPQGQRGLRC